jgi:UDP-N-acetylglucosamine 2-epimerase (non-hydrolysing)
MAPVEINRQNLLREGYPADHIHVTGGVVVDALELKRKEKMAESVFTIYPALADGKWIRLDIHRKENLGQRRFSAIFGALEELVDHGHRVSFVLMNATKHAIARWQLNERLEKLSKRSNFLATDVWPAYGHVVEFYDSAHCLAAWTDSGGVQEDMNLLGKPCLTIRFNTDRPETVMGNHGNILVPPISPEFLARMVGGIIEDDTFLTKLRGAEPIYGSAAGEKFAAAIAPYAMSNARAFRWSQNILGFDTSRLEEDPEF